MFIGPCLLRTFHSASSVGTYHFPADRLNTSESALQEAKFEVLSSEESYLRALDTLAHRVQAIEALQDPTVIADHDRDAVCKFLDSG